MIIETARLRLRPYRESDRDSFAAMNADPEVMRFFPAPKSRTESDQQFDHFARHFEEHGYSINACDTLADGSFVGAIGLARLETDLREALPGRPEVEIGWRFHKRFWGQGLAPEGARAWLDFAWTVLALPEVVAITHVHNLPSRRVMEKIGMIRDPDGDFDHPGIAEGNPVRPHVLYRISRP